MKNTNILVLLTTLLSACGGGDGTPAAASANVTPPANPPTCASLTQQGTTSNPKCHVTMLMSSASDSTMWGVDADSPCTAQSPSVGQGVINRACQAPAALLQAKFDADFGVGVVAVIDQSVPGSTLTSALNGTAPNTTPLSTMLSNLPVHADLVLIADQINDQYLLGQSYSTYGSYIQQAIGVVASYGSTPVYLEPNPISRLDMNISDPTYGTNALAYTADQMFSNSGYPVLGNLQQWLNYTSPPNAQPWNVVWMSSDQVHPSQAGYVQKINNYYNGVPNMVGSTYGLKQIVTNILQGKMP